MWFAVVCLVFIVVVRFVVWFRVSFGLVGGCCLFSAVCY